MNTPITMRVGIVDECCAVSIDGHGGIPILLRPYRIQRPMQAFFSRNTYYCIGDERVEATMIFAPGCLNGTVGSQRT